MTGQEGEAEVPKEVKEESKEDSKEAQFTVRMVQGNDGFMNQREENTSEFRTGNAVDHLLRHHFAARMR